MKNLFLMLVALGVFASCEKHNQKSTPCPTVAADAVPKTVTDAFALKYPTDSATTWYNVDGKAYCARFSAKGVDSYAHFSVDGTFQNEVTPGAEGDNVKQTGNHQDSSCDCGTENTEGTD